MDHIITAVLSPRRAARPLPALPSPVANACETPGTGLGSKALRRLFFIHHADPVVLDKLESSVVADWLKDEITNRPREWAAIFEGLARCHRRVFGEFYVETSDHVADHSGVHPGINAEFIAKHKGQVTLLLTLPYPPSEDDTNLISSIDRFVEAQYPQKDQNDRRSGSSED